MGTNYYPSYTSWAMLTWTFQNAAHGLGNLATASNLKFWEFYSNTFTTASTAATAIQLSNVNTNGRITDTIVNVSVGNSVQLVNQTGNGFYIGTFSGNDRAEASWGAFDLRRLRVYKGRLSLPELNDVYADLSSSLL